MEAVRLSYPDPVVPCVFTDASDFYWSGVVTQVSRSELQKPWNEQRNQPLAFLGKAFHGAEIRWSMFEKEAFSIVSVFKN